MRVVICDDQAIVREGLETILNLDPEIEVIGLAADGAAAVRLVEQQRPDLVLMDLVMPGMNGIAATAEIRARFPAVRVLVLTTYDADEWVFDALRVGAAGYLLKDTPGQELVRAVKGTGAGRAYLDPAVAAKVIQQATRGPAPDRSRLPAALTGGEGAVLRLLARGRTNTEIAAALDLSEGRVRNQVSSILTKLQVADRTQAALLAVQYGLDE